MNIYYITKKDVIIFTFVYLLGCLVYYLSDSRMFATYVLGLIIGVMIVLNFYSEEKDSSEEETQEEAPAQEPLQKEEKKGIGQFNIGMKYIYPKKKGRKNK